MMRWPAFGLLTLCAVCLAPPAGADGTALVRLAEAKYGVLAPVIAAYGTVAADTNHLSTIAAPRDCLIARIAVRPGQTVAPDDPIVVIASAPAAATQYQQAASALAFAEKDLTHTRELFAEQLATRSQVAAAEKALSDAKALIAEQNRIGADQPTQTLRSPVQGVVASISGAPGDRIPQGTAFATIATRSEFVVNVGVEPEDAQNLRVGASVKLRSPQNDLLAFTGRVVSVSAMMDPQSRLVNVVVAVPPQNARQLILGMVMQTQIALAPQRGIVIARDALMTDAEGTYVYVVRNGVARRQNVTLALEAETKALIARGVAAHDEVVVGGNGGLKDNMSVRTR
jgi:RND family efflux transporter MFP subunit